MTDSPRGRPVRNPAPAPRPGRNLLYHLAGLLILVLNKLRHDLRGYRTPRPFSVHEIERAVAYDFGVVEHWMRALREYAGGEPSLHGKKVLELGPGADLGVGLILLARGAASYHALDAHDLASKAPDALYDALFVELERKREPSIGVEGLRSQLEATRAGKNDRLDYLCREDFDLGVFRGKEVDLVVSQAVFEHFDDPDDVVARLSDVVRPGATLVAEIDLKTHTRWIRDADPLNIYRYSDLVYGALKFSGSPNRWRPPEYEQAFARHGWKDLRIIPGEVLDDAHVRGVQPSLAPRFRSDANRMEVLNLVLCATKA